MRIAKFAILISLTSLPTAASASNWWFVDFGGKKPSRTVFFIEKEGIRKIGSKMQAWEAIYRETANSSGVATEKQLQEYDCNDRTTSLISYIEYNRSGDVVRSDTISTYSRKTFPAAPDTLGESKLNVVCGFANDGFEIKEFDTETTGRRFLQAIDSLKK